jgi:hypothetical protein
MYRNWYMIIYGAIGTVALPVAAVLVHPALWFLWLMPVAILLVNGRQYVVVGTDEVEIRKLVRRYHLPLTEVEHLSVVCSTVPFQAGWRIRLQGRYGQVDTGGFDGLWHLRILGGVFPEPPMDAPDVVGELFEHIRANRDALVRSRPSPDEPLRWPSTPGCSGSA